MTCTVFSNIEFQIGIAKYRLLCPNQMYSKRTHRNIRSCIRTLVRGTIPCFKLFLISTQPSVSFFIFSFELHLCSLLPKPLFNTFNTTETSSTRKPSWRRTEIALTNHLNGTSFFLHWLILLRYFSFLVKNAFRMILSLNKSSHKE